MDNITQTRVLQLLSGVDASYSNERPRLAWVRAEVSPECLGNYTTLFSSIPIDRPYIQLLGDLGNEGDEAVFDDGLIVETCSISGLPYMDIFGPTYVSFETKEDEKILRDIFLTFQETGILPPLVTHPAVVFELSGFAPELFDVERSIVSGSREEPWPISDAIVRIREEFPTLSRQFIYAVIMAKRMRDTGSEFVFDLPLELLADEFNDLLLARSKSAYRCMNVNSGRVFSLGYDMYRLLLSIKNPRNLEQLPGVKLDDDVRREALERLRKIVLV